MQSQPVESQFSPDLLEDSEPVDGHIQVSTQPESQGSPDLLDPSQLSDFSCSPVQELPELPCLPELSDFSQRTDYQDPTTTDNQDPTTGNIGVQLNEPVGQSQANKRASRSRISFMNRCVRATKSFFLLYSEGTLYDEIDNHLYLNGKVITVPRKGITVYEIVWDTSTIPHIIINDSHLRRIVSRDDKDMVSRLKRAHVLFDEVYPDGPTTGVLSVGKPRNKGQSGKKSSGTSQQSTIPNSIRN